MAGAEEKRARRDLYVLVAKIAVPLALIALIPSLIGLYLVDRQNDKLAAQTLVTAELAANNSNLLRQVATVAAENSAIIGRVTQLAAEGKIAHDALCTWQDDLKKRAKKSRVFIADPPARIFGIPVTPEVIASAKSDLKGRESVLRALGDLSCRRPDTKPP